jgi:hypothetical protein
MTNVLPKATAHVNLDEDPEFKIDLCSRIACVSQSLYVENDDFGSVVLLDNPISPEGVVTAQDSNVVLVYAEDVLSSRVTFTRNPDPQARSDINSIVILLVDKNMPVEDVLEELTILRYQLILGWSYDLSQVGYEAGYPLNGVFVENGCGGNTEPTLEEMYYDIKFDPTTKLLVVHSSQPELDIGTVTEFQAADAIAPNGYKMVVYGNDFDSPNAPNGFTLREVVQHV